MRRPRVLSTLFRHRCPCLAQLFVSDPRGNSAPASSSVGGDNRTVDYPPRVPPLRRSFARCTSATTTSNSRHSVPSSLEHHPHHRRPPSRSRSRSRPSTFSHRWPRARAPARPCRLSPSPVRVGRLRSSWPSPSGERIADTSPAHVPARVGRRACRLEARSRGRLRGGQRHCRRRRRRRDGDGDGGARARRARRRARTSVPTESKRSANTGNEIGREINRRCGTISMACSMPLRRWNRSG